MISDNPKLTIPHRDPFLWVDRLIERNEKGSQGLVELDVKPNLELFKGHFPKRPIFPGVIQQEAAAQACMWIFFGVLKDGPMDEGLFVSVDSYKFKYPVEPNATLRIRCNQETIRGSLQKWNIEIRSKDDSILHSKGDFWLKMIEKKT